MKLALLGKGKTGSEIIGQHKGPITIFDRTNPVTLEKLAHHDVAISFLPGHALMENLETIFQSGLPLVSGSTGLSWPEDLDEKLRTNDRVWIWAFNFSLGMFVARKMIRCMAQARSIFKDARFHIHEIHHTSKIDAPSGTALTWQRLIGDADITHERVGDVQGKHILTMETDAEALVLTHEAKTRAIFAEGALLAAQFILDKKVRPGLHHFDDVIDSLWRV